LEIIDKNVKAPHNCEWTVTGGVPRLYGAWGKKKVWRPHVRTCLSEANALHWRKHLCDIVGTFWWLL